METMYIVAFNSTHNAIKTEKLLQKDDIKATTLPTPREISASCGISIKFEKDDIERVKNVLSENNIDCKGLFMIEKLEGGKRSASELN